MEMLRALATGVCRHCGGAITLLVGEWSPETWSHNGNGRPECPGALMASPVQGSVVAVDPL